MPVAATPSTLNLVVYPGSKITEISACEIPCPLSHTVITVLSSWRSIAIEMIPCFSIASTALADKLFNRARSAI